MLGGVKYAAGPVGHAYVKEAKVSGINVASGVAPDLGRMKTALRREIVKDEEAQALQQADSLSTSCSSCRGCRVLPMRFYCDLVL